jgi:hypothetical protein
MFNDCLFLFVCPPYTSTFSTFADQRAHQPVALYEHATPCGRLCCADIQSKNALCGEDGIHLFLIQMMCTHTVSWTSCCDDTGKVVRCLTLSCLGLTYTAFHRCRTNNTTQYQRLPGEVLQFGGLLRCSQFGIVPIDKEQPDNIFLAGALFTELKILARAD